MAQVIIIKLKRKTNIKHVVDFLGFTLGVSSTNEFIRFKLSQGM
jgi:hypothetical protein